MNGFTLLTMGCALVYLVIAISYLRLSEIRRLGREYGFFAGVAGGLSIASLGSSVITVSTETATSDVGLRLEAVGILMALGAFANFAYPNVQQEARGAARLATAIAVLGSVLAMSGLLFDPARTVSLDRSVGFASYPHPAMTPLGVFMSFMGLVVASKVMFDVIRSEARSTTGRYVLVAVVVGIGSWTGVLAFRASGHSLGPWFSVVLAPFITVVAAALVQRWSDVDVELEKRGAELEAAFAELKDAQNELVRREQLAAVGELSAVIAHEVRNPLAVLKNAVSGLRRENLATDIRDTLHGILDQETDRLNRLVRDLLSYAKPILVGHSDLDVRAMLERVVDTARRVDPRASEDVDVVFDIDAPDSIRADPDLLERALTHVVENAFQAMPNGGRLEVSAKRRLDDGTAQLAISIVDSGEGMDTLVRSRAKEPFFTTRREGTGLGLAIVERVASSHGGRLELARNAEGGSRVTLIIPETEVRSTSSDPPRRSNLLTPM